MYALSQALPAGTTSTDGTVLVAPGIQIVYGDTLAATSIAEGLDRPMLTYSWEPRTRMMTPGRFVRLTMRDFYYCSDLLKGDGALITASYDAGMNACDFPVQLVEKAMHWTLYRKKEAYKFSQGFTVSESDLAGLLDAFDNELAANNGACASGSFCACVFVIDRKSFSTRRLSVCPLSYAPLPNASLQLCGTCKQVTPLATSPTERRALGSKPIPNGQRL